MASEVLDVRDRIIASLFLPPTDSSYRSHVKIWEDDEGGGRKPRYIILAYHSPSRKGRLLKTKVNTAGSFSIGKQWELDMLRGFESYDNKQFHITLNRTYKWTTESPREQVHFLSHAVQLFRETNPGMPLNLVGNIPEIPQSQVTLPARRSPIPSDPPPPFSNSPPAPLRPGPRISQGHQRGLSSGSTGSGGRPRILSTEGLSRPNGLSSLNEPASPAQSSYSFQSMAAPLRSATPRGARQRPSGIVDGMPRPSNPPSRPGTGRQSSPPRTREAFSGSPPVNASGSFLQSPPRPQRGSSPIRLPSSPSRTSITPRGPRPNGSTTVAERQMSDAEISSRRRPSQSQERPSFEGRRSVRSESPALSVGSASRNQQPAIRRDPEPTSIPSSSATPPAVKRNGILPSPIHQVAPSLPAPSKEITPIPRSESPTLLEAEKRLANEVAAASGDLNEDDLEATLANVEDILEGYEWVSADPAGRRGQKGAADQIEARLLSELSALEKANTHSFIESDDRVAALLSFLDSAVTQLDHMDSLMSSYKIHLNIVGDDISHIQSQGKGLQVQSQNQRILLEELEQILQTVNVNPDALRILAQENMNNSTGIQRLESAAAELYKALQASRDKDMAASMERLQEYRKYNSQFCKRIFDAMQFMLMDQSKILSTEHSRNTSALVLPSHQGLETALGLYSGLILYLKEMDEDRYSKLCASYFGAASEFHSREMKSLLLNYATAIKKGVQENSESFGQSTGPGRATLQRSKSTKALKKGRDREDEGEIRGPEGLTQVITQVGRAIYREEEFMADFLQINDVNLTFADYASLENYFRRQAAQTAGLGSATTKLVKGATELIFGFLPEELKQWVDAALQRDDLQVVGMLASIERFMADLDERQNAFFFRTLERQHQRMKNRFDRHVQEQIKAIEKTKLTAKKRQGVAHFIRFFPTYAQRIEAQLVGVNILEVRESADAALERIVDAMFDTLQQMARIEGDSEEKEKGQLNYHVILIENMHYFLQEMNQIQSTSVTPFRRRADTIYKENLTAYVKIVLRRPFARILDYFDGVERLLQTTAPSEISNNSSYNRSATKRALKDYGAKDMKRLIDTLYKRVEKHFSAEGDDLGSATQSDGALASVWNACEEETVSATQRFEDLVNQCYSSLGIALEFSVSDVKAAFKRRS